MIVEKPLQPEPEEAFPLYTTTLYLFQKKINNYSILDFSYIRPHIHFMITLTGWNNRIYRFINICHYLKQRRSFICLQLMRPFYNLNFRSDFFYNCVSHVFIMWTCKSDGITPGDARCKYNRFCTSFNHQFSS